MEVPSPPPYSTFPFSPFSSIRHPGVGYADTRVSVCSTPGCQHLQHPGVVTQKTALLSTEIAKRVYRKQRIHSLCSTNGSFKSIKPPYLLHPMNLPIPSRTKQNLFIPIPQDFIFFVKIAITEYDFSIKIAIDKIISIFPKRM